MATDPIKAILDEGEPLPSSYEPQRPSWGDATYQVAKDFGEGAFQFLPATAGLLGDSANWLSRKVRSPLGLVTEEERNAPFFQLTPQFAGEAKNAFDALAGHSEDRVTGPAEDYSKAVLQSVAAPGNPLVNATVGAAAEGAQKAFPDNPYAPFLSTLLIAPVAGDGVQKVANIVEDEASALNRASLGLKPSTYRQSMKDTFVGDATKFDSEVKQAADAIADRGNFPKLDRDPKALLETNVNKISELSDEVSGAIDKADAYRIKNGNQRIIPKFSEAQAFIDSAPVGPTQDALQSQLDAVRNAFKNKTDGSVRFLQKQKRALYDQAYSNQGDTSSLPIGLKRAIAKDYKNAIEATTDAALPKEEASFVRSKNAEIGDHETLDAAFRANAGASEGETLAGRLWKSGRNILAAGAAGGLASQSQLGAYGTAGLEAGREVLTSPMAMNIESKLGKFLANTARGSSFAGGELPGSLFGGFSSQVNPISDSTNGRRDNDENNKAHFPNSITIPSGKGAQSADNGVGKSSNKFQMLGDIDPEDMNAYLGLSKKKVNMDSDISLGEKLAPYVERAESLGNPNAKSNKGAMGLFQLMPQTWAEWAPKVGIDPEKTPITDPDANRKVGIAYLNYLANRYNNNVPLTLAAYNWGLGHVDQFHKAFGSDVSETALKPHLPEETQNYLTKILKGYESA